MTETKIQLTVADGVATITLVDPPANTYSYEMMQELDAAVLQARLDDSVHVLVLLGAGEKFFCAGANIQMLQSVPCSRLHTVEQRCARWLLVCADRTEGATFELSQECLAELLGVPKSRSPGVARKLEQAGLICRRRGETTVVDRRELEAVACECYGIVRNRYERLLAQALG